MSDNLPIKDANAVTRTIRATDNGAIHSTHHVAEFLEEGVPTPVTEDSPLPVKATGAGVVSTVNSTDTLLAPAAVFTGSAEDVSAYDSVVVSAKTDQDGYFEVQFSNDGTNWDSTLTRYYRTSQIEAPHRFTITRKFVRVRFTNTSASSQTFLRLQTTFGSKAALNTPTDSTLSQDYDAIVTRPTDYLTEVALDRRQGSTLWNKFGGNEDIDIGTEVIASWGGAFTPMTTPRTLSVVSTSVLDTSGGTGANSLVVYGIDANRKSQIVVVTLNGTTPVVTTETWLGVNRVALYLSGSGQVNAGAITLTATTDLTIQGGIPEGVGTSQQCLFFTQAKHRSLIQSLHITTLRQSGGSHRVVTVKGWSYSAISNSRYEIVRVNIDTSVENFISLNLPLPLVLTESTAFWLEATTDTNNTSISARFSLVEHRDVDA
jgi:hypothetical protein